MSCWQLAAEEGAWGRLSCLGPPAAIGQFHQSLIASIMSLDQAVAALLDLLAAADEPGFCWGPEELRAACQWGNTLQQLADTTAGAAAVRQRLQVHRHRHRRRCLCLRCFSPHLLMAGQPDCPTTHANWL